METTLTVGGGTEQAVTAIQSVTGLDCNQAKTVLYWAVATHGQTKLQTFPILVIYGPYHSGKSTLLQLIGELAYEAHQMDGKATRAALRDALVKEQTVLIDEADETNEDFLVNRYSRNNPPVPVKRQTREGWRGEDVQMFGATVLHRRTPLRDPAIRSRAIVITTKRQSDVEPYDAESFRKFQEPVKSLAVDIPWANVKPVKGGRIADNLEPLRFVAEHLEDVSWLAYANVQIEKAQAALAMGQGEEPSHAAYRAVLALSLDGQAGVPLEKVLLKDVVLRLTEEGHDMNSWQVGEALREIGFGTKTVGGNQYVSTGGAEKLASIGVAIGVQDEWLEQMATQPVAP